MFSLRSLVSLSFSFCERIALIFGLLAICDSLVFDVDLLLFLLFLDLVLDLDFLLFVLCDRLRSCIFISVVPLVTDSILRSEQFRFSVQGCMLSF